MLNYKCIKSRVNIVTEDFDHPLRNRFLNFFVLFQVFNDKAVRRKILNLNVHCCFKDKECLWIGELRNLQVAFHDLLLVSISI